MSYNEAVANLLGEHFKSFFVIGYDYKGNCHQFINYHDQLELDGLENSVERAFEQLINDNDGKQLTQEDDDDLFFK